MVLRADQEWVEAERALEGEYREVGCEVFIHGVGCECQEGRDELSLY